MKIKLAILFVVALILTGCQPPLSEPQAVNLAITEYKGAFEACRAQTSTEYLADLLAYCSHAGWKAEKALLAKKSIDPTKVRLWLAKRVIARCADPDRPIDCIDFDQKDSAEALVAAEEAVEAAQDRCAERGGQGVFSCMEAVRSPAFYGKIRELGGGHGFSWFNLEGIANALTSLYPAARG
jgi:hypothetical protein